MLYLSKITNSLGIFLVKLLKYLVKKSFFLFQETNFNGILRDDVFGKDALVHEYLNKNPHFIRMNCWIRAGSRQLDA